MFILGIWANFDELEESLSLPELDMILKSLRDKQNEDRKFAAAIQGIDLDKSGSSDVEKRLEQVKHNAAVKLAGGESELERQELAALGFGFG